jgi:hypothetical protein
MANTQWSTTDKSASITLSNLNLTATTSSSGGVRAADRQVTGKWYFEGTFVVAPLISTAFGLAAQLCPIGSSSPSASGNYPQGNYVIGICSGGGGEVVQNGAILVQSMGTITTGTVVGVACDLTASVPQAWFRIGAAGNWNGNASANPATGVGGFPLWGRGIPVYPHCWLGQNGNQITANFGDSAFSGAVPSGYTSGFTAGATPALNEVLTQLGLESWHTFGGTIALQVTQTGIEVWATPTGGGTQVVLTKVGAEVWASVGAASVGAAQARVMIMA